MTKRVIDAKAALQDIRLGMSDLELKIKYRLSSKGLRSLFRRLHEGGLLKHVNPRQVQKDMRAGMSDKQLMDKYQLSRIDLEDMLKQVDRIGLLRLRVEKDGKPGCSSEIAQEIVQDIRSGVGRTELMTKYRLSALGMRWVCIMLVRSGAISCNEIYENICTRQEEFVPGMNRSHRRYPVHMTVPVRDIGRPEHLGKICDMSEAGVRVQGIDSAVGETRTLMVSGDEFGEYSTFVLDVITRWVSLEPNGDSLSGFKISRISLAGMAEFNLLLDLVRLPHIQKIAGLLNDLEPKSARHVTQPA